MAATMATPRSGDNATSLGNNAELFCACLATTMPHLGDNTNLGNKAMLLSARLVTMMPSSETLGNNTKLCNDSTLCDNNATLGNIPGLSTTTPSLLHEPYEATLGNNATLGDDDAKLGEDATLLLLDDNGGGDWGSGSGEDNKDSGSDIQTTINLKRQTINNQLKKTQQLARTTIKTPSGNRDRDGDAGDSDGDGVCVCNGGWQASGG
jgi:hypothetical protein